MSTSCPKIPRAAAIAVNGLTGHLVTVEAAVSNQLPGMTIIGLPDAALNEAKQRVKLACANSGFKLSQRFLTVNLSPATLPKNGSGFDLAIALTCLSASGCVPDPQLSKCAFIGELGLDGQLKRVAGVLPAVLEAKKQGFSRVLVAAEAAQEAQLVTGIQVIAVNTLLEAVQWLTTGAVPKNNDCKIQKQQTVEDLPPDFADVLGQEAAVTALTVAAAGRHHVLMSGAPGAGKTMLANCLTGILPRLNQRESLESSSIAAIGGASLEKLITLPPFVAPHHTASCAAIVGSASANGTIRPGAITQAHNGVLFLDEAAEFAPKVLDSLRQPLEKAQIVISRAKQAHTLPAHFQLVLATNPCPCGKAQNPLNAVAMQCVCTPAQQMRYQNRISGPLKDRIDVQLRIEPVHSVRQKNTAANNSAQLQNQVLVARKLQAKRYQNCPWKLNSSAPASWLRGADNQLPAKTTTVLDSALSSGIISLRGYDRVLRLAWSFADLAGKPRPERTEIAQALILRGANYA